MPTVAELHERFQYLVDDKIQADRSIMLFNEALEDLSEVGDYETETTIPMSAEQTSIELPEDYMKTIALYVQINDDTYLAQPVNRIHPEKKYGDYARADYYQYEEYPQSLRLLEAPKTDFSVVLRYMGDYPSIPTTSVDPSMSYVPKLPKRFHRALSLFAAFRYYENWEDNSSMRRELYEQYLTIKTELRDDGNRRSNKRRPNRIVQTERWF